MAANEENMKAGGKRLSALGDLIFHKTFASEENKDILAGLAEDFYGIKTKSITILDPYDIRVYTEKTGAARLKTGRGTPGRM